MENGFDTFIRLAVALAIGILVGLERGWHERAEPEGRRVAGIRTFGLIGLLGGVWALLAEALGEVVMGLAFIALAAALIVARFRLARDTKDYGITTTTAALLTFGLGAIALRGELAIAASVAVITALLLSSKATLHGFLKRIDYQELLAVLKLLTMSVVLLPVLPDRGFGPWEALNPYELWLMVVLISGISFAGYVAVRAMGERRGILVAALAGGLVSSTAVTISLSRMGAQNPERARLLSGGIVLASSMMFARTILVASVIQSDMLRVLAVPLGGAFAMGTVAGIILLRKSEATSDGHMLQLRNPFEFGMALKFGVLLAVIMVLSEGLLQLLGHPGIYALASVSGLADVDAVTLAVSRMTEREISHLVAAVAILLASLSNSLVKGGIAIVNGGAVLGRQVAFGLLAALVTGTLGAMTLLESQ